MRRAIIFEYERLADNLANYVGLMNFRFMNLCIKAEPASLIPVEISIDGEKEKLENCADVAKEDDYQFMIIPKFEEDLKDIMRGIALSHPEFKQEIQTKTVVVPDEDGGERDYDVKYLLLTMPEVDDDRYDVLKEGVKLIYDDCKLRMEAANNKAKVKFSQLAFTETKENLELLDKELDKLNKQWNEQRDKLRDNKIEEIDAAYNKWLGSFGREEIARMEEEDAHSTDAGMSMKMKSDK